MSFHNMVRGRVRRAGLRATINAPGDVIEGIGFGCLKEFDVSTLQALIEREKVGAVGIQGILGQATFHPNCVEETIHGDFRILVTGLVGI